jgi:hypothetical protein
MSAIAPNVLIDRFRESRSIPDEETLKSLLDECSRPDSQLEGAVELKERFTGDAEAWLNLERQIVGFANAGGGLIVFGISDQNQTVGLPTSIVDQLDPANILNKLQRHAPNAAVPTAYIELTYHKKRYGILLIGRPLNLIVFDKVGNVPKGAKTRTIIQPGVIYCEQRA